MGEESSELDRLLAAAEEAARAAGEILLPRFGNEQVLATKSSDTDVVSQADLAAERAIRDVLARLAPDDAIMGEEGVDTPGSSGRRWIVDPLDGTVNFLYGIPIWCVSVACEGLVGVILDPVRDEFFSGVAGRGAWLDGVRLAPPEPPSLGQALVATGFGYDSERRRLQAQVAARVIPQVRDVRRGGAAALDLAWCAAGRIDAYWERGVNQWDIAAGELICAGAGRSVERLEPSGDLPWGVLAAPPSIAGDLRTFIV